MVFRVQMSLEIERPEGALATNSSADVEILYQAGRWRATCRKPPVSTPFCDSMEAALVAVVKEVAREWHAEGLEVGGTQSLL